MHALEALIVLNARHAGRELAHRDTDEQRNPQTTLAEAWKDEGTFREFALAYARGRDEQ